MRRTDVGQEILEQSSVVNELIPSGSQFLDQISNLFSSTINILVIVVIVLFISIYLTIEPYLYVDGFLRLIPAARRGRMREVLHQVTHTLRWWLFSRGVAMLAVGILSGIGLSLIGVPLVLALSVIAALLELIPNIGPILSAIPTILVALSVGMDKALYVALLYFGIQQAESYLITPLIERRTVKLPPALTIIMQVLLGTLIGPLGVVLAASLTAIGLVVVKMLYVEDALHEPTDVEDT